MGIFNVSAGRKASKGEVGKREPLGISATLWWRKFWFEKLIEEIEGIFAELFGMVGKGEVASLEREVDGAGVEFDAMFGAGWVSSSFESLQLDQP
jgi:hypothetical protein